MLEPMDIYRLSRFLREQGEAIEGPEDLLAQYTHPDMLADRLPIFLLNTDGPENACVFLKNGRCSVYEARPRVCRMYPFTVVPGDQDRDFLYCLCTERSACTEATANESYNIKPTKQDAEQSVAQMLAEMG